MNFGEVKYGALDQLVMMAFLVRTEFRCVVGFYF